MNEIDLSKRREIIVTVLMAIVIVMLAGGMALFVLSDSSLGLPVAFFRVTEQIRARYAEPVDWDKLTASSSKSMFEELDRFSYFIEPRQYDRLDEEMSGAYVGIGVSVVAHELGLQVMTVREAGPAAASGVQTGDVIIQADSARLASLDPDRGSLFLRGIEGTTVHLRVYRPTIIDTLSIDVIRQRITFQHVQFAGFRPDSILYVRLTDFDAGATEQLRHALDSLLSAPGQSARGLILDMRGNPGGLFSEAFETANLFLKRGDFIVGTSGRSYWNEEEHVAEGDDITGGLTMVVLVDRGTASAAEIVSGALQQNRRAVLVGDTTYGKGLVQGFTRFEDGSGTRLTISRYFLAGNLYLNQFDSTLHDTGSGLVPDISYDFPGRRPFLRALEGSMLMQEFAASNQDAIISAPGDFAPGGNWLERFMEFTSMRKFTYHSAELKAAEELFSLAVDEKADQSVVAGARALLEIAKRAMAQAFYEDSSHIRTRLRELAFEHKYGLNRAYAEVVIRERSDINRAAEILTGRR